MTSEPTDAQIFDFGRSLYRKSERILERTLQARADLSLPVFMDVSKRWHRDMGRLVQSARISDGGPLPESGIRPAKYAGFVAFWVRKLKPISRAYYHRDFPLNDLIASVDPAKEIRHINEIIAIRLAVELLRTYIQQGVVNVTDVSTGKPCPITWNEPLFAAELKSFFDQKLGIGGMSVLESLLYDMRYRTFGPHHLVHLFDQLVFNLKPQTPQATAA